MSKRKRTPETPTEALARLTSALPTGTWYALPHLGVIKAGGVPIVQADSATITYLAYLHSRAQGHAQAVETLQRVGRTLGRIAADRIAAGFEQQLTTEQMIDLVQEIQEAIQAAGARVLELNRGEQQ